MRRGRGVLFNTTDYPKRYRLVCVVCISGDRGATMSRKVKAHHLIRSFEHQEGLDPDRDDEVLKTEIDEEERKEDGNTHRLAALFDRVWVGDVRQRGASWSGRSRSGSESDQKVLSVI